MCMVNLQLFEVMCVETWFSQKGSADFVKSGHSFSLFMPYILCPTVNIEPVYYSAGASSNRMP